MTATRRLCCAVLVVALGLAVADAQSARRSTLRAALASRVSSYSLNADDYLDALLAVAARFKIPMLIEWARNADTTRKVSLSWQAVKVRRVIADVVSSAQGYQFRSEGGILHIYRWDLLNDKRNFMNITVPDYHVTSEYEGVASRNLVSRLHRLEVPPPPPPPGPRRPSGIAGSIATGEGDRPMTFSLQNATVRDILAEFNRRTDFKVFIVTLDPSAPLTPGGYWRTVDPVTGRGASASNAEPTWEELMWGQKPY